MQYSRPFSWRDGYIAFMETIIKKIIVEIITLIKALHIRYTSFPVTGCDNRRWLTVLQLPLICLDNYIIFDKLCQFTIYLQILRYYFCLTILKI